MNLDNTYIDLFGCILYEPGVIITNLTFFVLCLAYFRRLARHDHAYASQMALFILFMGISGLFGAVAHAVHYQLGNNFFESVFFIMNALSLFSIYYCFRAPYTYYKLNHARPRRYVYMVFTWILVLLVFSIIKGNFMLIKIHAGITLLYSFIVHYLAYRRNNERGSAFIVLGIGISFLSIVVHSLGFSLHRWFNYKDIAHVIMIISLIMIYHGIKLNLENLGPGQVEPERVKARV